MNIHEFPLLFRESSLTTRSPDSQNLHILKQAGLLFSV